MPLLKINDFIKTKTRQNALMVAASLVATIIGASTTYGLANFTYDIGFPAFWWLFSASVFLFLQAIFLSKKIREIDSLTLPDLANIVVGKLASKLCAGIIVIVWVGIIAAQFIALAQFLEIIFKHNQIALSYKACLYILAGLTIAYTALGGQRAILKTDFIQIFLLGTALILVFLNLANWQNFSFFINQISLTNEKFTSANLLNIFFIVGGAYLLGPDILSRNILAKDASTAKKSAFLSAGCLLIFSFLIVYLGIFAKYENFKTNSVLVHILLNYLPLSLAILFAVGLICALLSSADTCLLTSASILEHDLIKDITQKTSLFRLKLFIVAIGIIALIIVEFKSDIIALLLSVYSIYVPAIVMPLSIAVFYHKKKIINQNIWLLAVVIGSLCGIIDNLKLFQSINFALCGMILSAIISLCSLREINKKGKKYAQ